MTSLYDLNHVARLTQRPAPRRKPEGSLYDLGHVARLTEYHAERRRTPPERRSASAYDLSAVRRP